MAQRDPGPIPNRWLNCPRKATGLFADRFLAFKTPLGSQFNDKVPEQNRFTPAMLFMYMKQMKVKLGLWIDLTNTSRFYDKKEIEKMDCNYVKMQCRGHGETPSLEQTREFIHIVTKFQSQSTDVIGVHCTHGFNRTGFLLVSYMVDQLDCSVEVALNAFATIRPPGIYKQDYIQELYKRYDDMEYTPAAPARPDWCIEDEEVDYDDDDNDKPSNSSSDPSKPKKKKGRRETTHKKTVFMPGVRGVEPFNNQPRLSEIQRKSQDYCEWNSTGFPGSQPVSMDTHNIRKLHEKPYRVSWKADGVRFNRVNKRSRDRKQIVNQWKSTKLNTKKEMAQYRKQQNLTGGGPKPPSPSPDTLEVIEMIPQEFEIDYNEYDCDGIDTYSDDTKRCTQTSSSEPVIVITEAETHFSDGSGSQPKPPPHPPITKKGPVKKRKLSNKFNFGEASYADMHQARQMEAERQQKEHEFKMKSMAEQHTQMMINLKLQEEILRKILAKY